MKRGALVLLLPLLECITRINKPNKPHQTTTTDADPNLNNDDDNPANITPIDNAKAGRPIFCQSYVVLLPYPSLPSSPSHQWHLPVVRCDFPQLFLSATLALGKTRGTLMG